MGRPLYSRSFQAPIVRIEPEREAHSAPEKWSYWNRFDPDADEFFENDNAVYEAVIDASQPPIRMQGIGENTVEVVEDSNSSSEGTSSGRGSPLDEYAEALSEGADEWVIERVPQRMTRPRVIDPSPGHRHVSTGNEIASDRGLSSQPFITYGDLYEYNSRSSPGANDPISSSPPSSGFIPSSVPYTSDTTPPRTPSPRPYTLPILPGFRSSLSSSHSSQSSASVATPVAPSTPPNQTSVFYGTPSPAPTVTPRLFQWSIRPVTAVPISPSPASPTGPLTNHSARRSVARINPVHSLVPMNRVIG